MTNTTPKTSRVFLVDDHPLMRAGTAKVINMELDMEVCGELGEGRGFVEALESTQPDVILLDLSLPDRNGLELIKDCRAAGNTAAILVLSMHDEKLYAERVIRAGANGFLMKEEATCRVIEGIRKVLQGDVYISEEMNRQMLKRMAGHAKADQDGILHQLTDREFEVFELIGNGLPSRAIAARLKISPKTVGAHRANMKEKLGIADGSELVRFAVRWMENGPGKDGLSQDGDHSLS